MKHVARWLGFTPKADAAGDEERVGDPRPRLNHPLGLRTQGLMLGNVAARLIMGWHVAPDDRQRFWRDGAGQRVTECHHGKVVQLVAAPFVPQDHREDGSHEVWVFSPARFDSNWTLFCAQLTRLGIEIEQSPQKTIARCVNGQFVGPSVIEGGSTVNGRRLAAIYAACRLCTDGLVDNVLCGDVDRFEVEQRAAEWHLSERTNGVEVANALSGK